jgi:hypothetical protein
MDGVFEPCKIVNVNISGDRLRTTPKTKRHSGEKGRTESFRNPLTFILTFRIQSLTTARETIGFILGAPQDILGHRWVGRKVYEVGINDVWTGNG